MINQTASCSVSPPKSTRRYPAGSSSNATEALTTPKPGSVAPSLPPSVSAHSAEHSGLLAILSAVDTSVTLVEEIFRQILLPELDFLLHFMVEDS